MHISLCHSLQPPEPYRPPTPPPPEITMLCTHPHPRWLPLFPVKFACSHLASHQVARGQPKDRFECSLPLQVIPPMSFVCARACTSVDPAMANLFSLYATIVRRSDRGRCCARWKLLWLKSLGDRVAPCCSTLPQLQRCRKHVDLTTTSASFPN